MIYQFQADGWDAPIAVEVTFTPAGVSAVSPDGFEFTGPHDRWAWFEAHGWAWRDPRDALDELAQIDQELRL